MEIQISKKPEIIIGITCNLGHSAKIGLPLSIGWWYSKDVKGNKCFWLEIDILCIRLFAECWSWHPFTSSTEQSKEK